MEGGDWPYDPHLETGGCPGFRDGDRGRYGSDTQKEISCGRFDGLYIVERTLLI